MAALVSEVVPVLIYDGEYECHPGRHAGWVHDILVVMLGVGVACAAALLDTAGEAKLPPVEV